jgi:hypothetical protein
MRRCVVLAAGGLLVLAAACGRPAPTGAGPGGAGPTVPSPAPTSTTAPPAAAPPTTGAPVAAGRVDASALPPDERHDLWTAQDGRTVGMQEEQTGCTTLRMEVAEQSAQQVRLVLVSTTATHQMCPHYVRQVAVTATLDAPLGDRAVVLQSRKETR